MPIDAHQFRQALGSFASGITVATTHTQDNAPIGITISAFSSLSLTPPLILFCLDKKAHSHQHFSNCKQFAVNILEASQKHVAKQFAGAIDKRFENIDYTAQEHVPHLTDCLTTIHCSLHKAVDGGDHTIFIGLVEHIKTNDGKPLLHYQSDYYQLDSTILT